MADASENGWQHKFAWFPTLVDGRWIWLCAYCERGHKVFVERRLP